MGDIGKSLLHAVGLGGNSTPAATPGVAPLTAPQEVSSSDVLYGTGGLVPPPPGSVQKTTPMSFVDSLFQTQNNTPADANADAQAPAFTPHKRTTLGMLGDMLLSGLAHGRVTPFADKAYNENLSEAMQSYAKDPARAISMVNQFDPRLGMRLEAQYSDDKRADDVAARLKAAADDKYISRAASMYNTATADNFASVDLLARRYLKAKGIDPDTAGLPTNADEAKTFAAGDINPYQSARLQQFDTGLQIRENNNNVDNAEQHRHNVAMENKPTGKDKSPPKLRTISRDGQPLGVLSPDGTTARLYDRGSKTWVEFRLTRPNDITSKVFNGYVDAAGNLVDGSGKIIRKAKGAQ